MIPTPAELQAHRAEHRLRNAAASDQTVDRWLIHELGRALAEAWRRAVGRAR